LFPQQQVLAQLKTELSALLAAGIARVAPVEAPPAIVLERPKQARHGDYLTHVAMPLARAGEDAQEREIRVVPVLHDQRLLLRNAKRPREGARDPIRASPCRTRERTFRCPRGSRRTASRARAASRPKAAPHD